MSDSKSAAIILAAGASKRFGSPKALAKIGDRTALNRVIRSARDGKFDPVHVVLGADNEKIQSSIEISSVKVVYNFDYEKGQTSSLQVGLREINDSTDAVALFLVDHPFVQPQTLEKLRREFLSHPKNVVRPVFEKRGGHPILFPFSLRDELLRVSPEDSARNVFFAENRMRDVVVEDEGVIQSFNTREELEKILSHESKR